MSPTDHVFSKAIYLDDPDGIGLEFTLETPERLRSVRMTPQGPEVIDSSGRKRSGRDPLDVQEVLATLPDSDIDRPLPVGTKIGHVHLHVGDIDAGHRFYENDLGFILANDFGAVQPPAGTAGLRYFVIRYDSAERLQAALERVDGAQPHADGHLVRDPAGNAMVLTR
jgi:catechol 2,3-dioxygenase